MTAGPAPARPGFAGLGTVPASAIGAGLAFVVLFWEPMTTLGRDWWRDPEAGHGLLLGPLAVILAWRRGRVVGTSPAPGLGLGILAGAVVLRYLSGLAAELFTMRVSMLAAAAGLIVFTWGVRQLLHWWLPGLLLLLSVPIPAVLLNTVAFPLQLEASRMAAGLLNWRHVPVALAGNIIHLPGQSLFVTEACSGLRSLTALLALGVLTGGLWRHTPLSRVALVAVGIPIAMLINGIRVFLTGFLAYYVSPSLASGFMHYTEGWAMFTGAFGLLGTVAWGLARLERHHPRRTSG